METYVEDCTNRMGVVDRIGNRDFFFVADLETAERFFCHRSCVADDKEPRKGDKVTFDFLLKRVAGKSRPISRLEVL